MAIRFLSPLDAQKVAAGEVVERPANIIKELLENSIDAGATRIELAVRQGGKSHIRITDNGCGMSHEDAHLSFQRYATSKLTSFEDLYAVNTFGFRGEALASICSVAQVTITTKQQGQIEGLSLSIAAGAIHKTETVSCPVGTTIIADDIFYAIPVRKKFLKSTVTEWNQIHALFKAFCLTYPAIHFVLLHDDVQVYNCPPVKSVEERCHQLFEKTVSSCILTIEPFTTKDIQVSGVITNPQYSRYDRGGLYFFVNNRLVKNYQLARAVMKGFAHVLPGDKYPLAVISVHVDPLSVDVNVHPKKEEVLFLHPHLVEQAITQAVKATLETYTSQRLQQTSPVVFTNTSTFTPHTYRTPGNNNVFKAYTPAVFPTLSDPFTDDVPTQFSTPSSAQQPSSMDRQEPCFDAPTTFSEEPFYNIIGQLHLTYILLEHADGLLVVDQHAAHERILYERMEQNFGKQETIELLFPPVLTLSPHDIQAIADYLPLLHQEGITIEQFGPEQLRVKAVPVYAKQIALQELIEELVAYIREHNAGPTPDFFKKITEKIRAQVACKAAVKAGDSLSKQEMIQLLKDLNTTNHRFSCPHGRPTQWLLPLSDIERRFKRIV